VRLGQRDDLGEWWRQQPAGDDLLGALEELGGGASQPQLTLGQREDAIGQRGDLAHVV
jgi:hypothetical protein